ncbi:formin-like protein 4 [Scleropages formosus]|uniref:formin-like protein 4 n=1 Tax=Scleropages formosus TaxID=113540 RepID=UPI0010FA6E78|nr:formin-like protein 4 [Scleropages formosus]
MERARRAALLPPKVLLDDVHLDVHLRIDLRDVPPGGGAPSPSSSSDTSRAPSRSKGGGGGGRDKPFGPTRTSSARRRTKFLSGLSALFFPPAPGLSPRAAAGSRPPRRARPAGGSGSRSSSSAFPFTYEGVFFTRTERSACPASSRVAPAPPPCTITAAAAEPRTPSVRGGHAARRSTRPRGPVRSAPRAPVAATLSSSCARESCVAPITALSETDNGAGQDSGDTRGDTPPTSPLGTEAAIVFPWGRTV